MLSAIQVKPVSEVLHYLTVTLENARRRRQLATIVQQTYAQFAQQNPEKVDALFDAWFLTHSARPLLERYVSGTRPPTAEALAVAWEGQLGGSEVGRKRRVAAMIPVTAEFLRTLEEALSFASEQNYHLA